MIYFPERQIYRVGEILIFVVVNEFIFRFKVFQISQQLVEGIPFTEPDGIDIGYFIEVME